MCVVHNDHVWCHVTITGGVSTSMMVVSMDMAIVGIYNY